MSNGNFPDKEFLKALAGHLRSQIEAHQRNKLSEQIVMYSGAALNWIADYITDENISWERETIFIDQLWLTGTNPEWNKIVIDKCQRSPRKLKEALRRPAIRKIFKKAEFNPLPILVRYEDEKYKVLDGMHRVIGAILKGKKQIKAWIAMPQGKPSPRCEPHVVYDLLRAYQRGLNKDRKALLIALKFLKKSYGNVEGLLKHRFNKKWLPDDEIQEIIQEALKD